MPQDVNTINVGHWHPAWYAPHAPIDAGPMSLGVGATAVADITTSTHCRGAVSVEPSAAKTTASRSTSAAASGDDTLQVLTGRTKGPNAAAASAGASSESPACETPSVTVSWVAVVSQLSRSQHETASP